MKSDAEVNKLVRDNFELVYNHMAHLNIFDKYPDLIDDIQSECYLALFNSAKKWEPTTAKFSSYAFTAIRNAIHNVLDYRSQRMRLRALSISIYNDHYDNIEKEGEYIDHRPMIELCRKNLNGRDLFIFNMLHDGVSCKDISVILGITKSRVGQLVDRMYGKLRNILSQEWFESFTYNEDYKP